MGPTLEYFFRLSGIPRLLTNEPVFRHQRLREFVQRRRGRGDREHITTLAYSRSLLSKGLSPTEQVFGYPPDRSWGASRGNMVEGRGMSAWIACRAHSPQHPMLLQLMALKADGQPSASLSKRGSHAQPALSPLPGSLHTSLPSSLQMIGESPEEQTVCRLLITFCRPQVCVQAPSQNKLNLPKRDLSQLWHASCPAMCDF